MPFSALRYFGVGNGAPGPGEGLDLTDIHGWAFGTLNTPGDVTYYFDEEHIAHWLDVSRTPEGTQEYLEEYVYSLPDFAAYLEKVGGQRRMEELKQIMQLHPVASVEAVR